MVQLLACSSRAFAFSMAPTDKVSTLPAEINDTIFSFLSFDDLLSSQRVSRHWCDSLNDSQHASRTPFRYRTPLMLETNNAVKKAFLQKTWDAAVAGSEYDVVYCRYHPLVRQIRTDVRASDPTGFLHMTLRKPYFKSAFGTSDKQACPNASWRAMFVTHPPIQKAVMTLQMDRHHIRKESRRRARCGHLSIDKTVRTQLDNSLGITWGEILFEIANKANSYGPRYKTMERWAGVPPQRWMKYLPKDMKVTIRPETSELMQFPTEEEAERLERWDKESSDEEEETDDEL